MSILFGNLFSLGGGNDLFDLPGGGNVFGAATSTINNPADSVAYGVAFAVAGAPCSLPAPLLRL